MYCNEERASRVSVLQGCSTNGCNLGVVEQISRVLVFSLIYTISTGCAAKIFDVGSPCPAEGCATPATLHPLSTCKAGTTLTPRQDVPADLGSAKRPDALANSCKRSSPSQVVPSLALANRL